MKEVQVENDETRRRKREGYIIVILGISILLFTYIETHISSADNSLPIATNIFVYGLININIILLVLLIFLVLRNFAKLFLETRSNVIGSRLRTKLILSFIALSIIPTLLLFFVAIGFINKSIEGWFSIKVEESLTDSLELAQNYYKNTLDRTLSGAREIALKITDRDLLNNMGFLRTYVEEKRDFMDLSAIEVYSDKGDMAIFSISPAVNRNMVPSTSAEILSEALNGESKSFIKTMDVGDIVRSILPIINDQKEVIGAVTTTYYVPLSLMTKIKKISATFASYKQLNLLKNPVKASYFTILLLVTMVIVFFAIWIGRYVAKGITDPIQELAEGTNAVANGNYDYRIKVETRDEIGRLVSAFNRMTEDLKANKSRLEVTNIDLRSKNEELEQRRRYIEIVLSNISAGVISIDKGGRIIAINKVAGEILGLGEREVIGTHYKDVLYQQERETLKEMIREMGEKGVEMLERQIKVRLREKTITVLVNLTVLKDEYGSYLGVVAVLDDLTHLLKTQRMMAWKEVARRIAHEVKNPLTPIQLSAQRLRKKYMDKFSGDARVFDECTNTIIRQVEELKILVNEFSNFAKMPTSELSPNDLNGVIKETIALYESGHRRIGFHQILDDRLPIVEVDREQMKRALINLIDNSIASMKGAGDIYIKTHYDDTLRVARIEVADNGCGIPIENRGRLFEPYFSTKKSGTGLGLAIVGNIIADHNGYVRVKDNKPEGTIFIIDIPIKGMMV